MSNQIKTLGILSLVFGITSLVLFCIPIFSLVLAATGVIVGTIGVVQASKTNEPKGNVISGMIISILSLLIALAFNGTILFGLWEFKDFIDGGDFFDNTNDAYYDPYDEDLYYDPNDIDTNLTDVDSLLLDNDQINDLDNSNPDFDNGPEGAPN